MNQEALRLARIIWDYQRVGQQPVPADAIVAFGTHDLRVAEFAADLWLGGLAPLLACTGGIAHQGDLLATPWEKTEAEMYADVAAARGVPRDSILLEKRATNTAQNVRFTRELFRERGIRPRNLLVACKPFMGRRVRATLSVEWPRMPATVTSPETTLEEYFTHELSPANVINIMMGDLQRVWVYGRRGWSAPQEIPPEVRAAYDGLVALGFTKHLIAED
jgi:uncharacterized SAM-binding protein YcdF (DUF218 family)